MPSADPQAVQDRAVLSRMDRMEIAIGEARDATIKLTAIIGEQRYGERIEALHGDLERCIEKLESRITSVETVFRADLVHAIQGQEAKRAEAIASVNRHVAEAARQRGAMEARLASLEAARTEAAGRAGVFKWIADHGGWLISLGGVLAWLLGLTPKPPHS